MDALSLDRRYAAVLEPRRSSKTTTVLAWALGRAFSRPDYAVAYYAGTSGKAARDQFLKYVIPKLEGLYPDPDTRPFRIRKGAGQERVEFTNGSLFQVCATPEDFRGATFDLILIDEAGELDGEKFVDVLAAASPTQDTTPQPVMVFMGTAGKSRQGNALWDFLERGRKGDADVAVIEYSAGRDLTQEDWETWELAEPLILASHPGVGTLTTIDAVRNNYSTMTLETFGREYLGIFSERAGVAGAIHPAKWLAASLTDAIPETPPGHFVWGVSAHVNQSCAAIAAAWRDADGQAHVLIADWREGVEWLPAALSGLAAANTGVPFAHDTKGPITLEVERASRLSTKLKLAPQTYAQVQQAAQLLVREVHRGNLRHYGQKHLDEAAAIATIRGEDKAWLFGRPKGGDTDITSLEAASLALRLLDSTPAKRQMVRTTLPA